MTDLPPDISEMEYQGDPVPDLPDPPGSGDEAIGFDNEAERAELRPSNADYQYGSGTSYSGYNEDYRDTYLDLGGLTRPDAYFGAIEFDCPACQAKAKTPDRDGEKCRVWVERLNRHVVRHVPCLARIKLAHEKGYV